MRLLALQLEQTAEGEMTGISSDRETVAIIFFAMSGSTLRPITALPLGTTI
jgi:hypothetical protein